MYAYISVSMLVKLVYSGLRPFVITHFNTIVSTFRPGSDTRSHG